MQHANVEYPKQYSRHKLKSHYFVQLQMDRISEGIDNNDNIITLIQLRDCPEYLREVANLIWAQFRMNYVISFGYEQEEQLIEDLTSFHIHPPHPSLALPCFIALDRSRNTVIGVCNLVPDNLGHPHNKEFVSMFPWLANLVVKDEYRNQGIGSQLVITILDYLKRKSKLDVVYLWCSEEKQVRFYDKFGFEVTKTRLDMMLYDTVYIMQKKLH